MTLFGTRDSIASAHLHAAVDRGCEEDRCVDPKVAECLHISEAFEHAAEFDLIHSHYDFMALAYTRLVTTPVLDAGGVGDPKLQIDYRAIGEFSGDDAAVIGERFEEAFDPASGVFCATEPATAP